MRKPQKAASPEIVTPPRLDLQAARFTGLIVYPPLQPLVAVIPTYLNVFLAWELEAEARLERQITGQSPP